jgi:5-methylthioadenosine/S-adenosylhomocysteine deaminase
MTPNMHPESNLIYALQGSDVKLTMVDGKVLYRDGEYPTIDAEAVLRSAGEGANEMYARCRAEN